MRAVVFGASGMVGQGVVRECLASAEVEAVLLVVRSATGPSHPKVRELIQPDLYDYTSSDLAGYDACFFCLGVSSSGMTESDYHRVTHDLTLAAAMALLAQNPGMTFIYVSGAGTGGTSMWARVKGQTENDLLGLGFRRAYMFRPAYIQPIGGVKSRTRIYRIVYAVMAPLYPLWKVLFPGVVTTTESIGQAMIRVALAGYERPVLETRDINAVATAR